MRPSVRLLRPSLLLCSRASVHTTREHGPSTRPVNTGSMYRASVNTDRVHGSCLRVYTGIFDHPLTRAVLTKSIVVQCFLKTRPVDTGAQYTLPVLPCRRHGPCSQLVRSERPCRRIVIDNDCHNYFYLKTLGIARVTNTVREHGCPK